jgi:uncharacterized protein DUF2059
VRFAAALPTRAALAAAFALGSAAQAQENLDLANRLFERSGLAAQLRSFPEQFEEQGLAQQRGKLPDEVVKALAGAARQSFAPAALRAEIVPALARKVTAEDMKRVLAWLDGPAGRRMTLAEERAGTMTQESVQAYLEREKARPSSAKRARLLADLIAATRAEETEASIIEAIALGIAVGMDATQPQEKRIGVAALRERLRAAMPPDRLRASLKAALPVMYGYTYREIGDADLAAYVKFNGSPLGRRYNQAVTEALGEALTGASVRVGEIIQAASGKKAL